MTPSTDRATRATRDAANLAAVAVVIYAVLWVLSTQIGAIREVSPFADDPWDAVASYAAIFLPVIAGATWIRSLGHRERALPVVTARRIRWGSGLAAAIVLVAAGVDAVAIVTIGVSPDAAVVGAVLAGLTGGSVVAAAAAITLTIRAASVANGRSVVEDAEPDVLDDLLTIAVDIAAAAGFGRPAERAARATEAFLDGSSVSPRRHRIAFGLVIAFVTAVMFVLWHAFREGPWINAAVPLVFGTLIGIGVLGVYLGTVFPLRLLRPPR
jgi:hypothetical protein